MHVVCKYISPFTVQRAYLDVVSGSGSSRDDIASSSLVDPCWNANPNINAVKATASSEERDWVKRPSPFDTLGL